MSVVPLSLDPNAEARALLNFLLRHGDIIGMDHAGRTILQLAVDPWTLDQLAAFDADARDLEDSDSEPDGPAVILDLVPPKQVGRLTRVAQVMGLALLLVTAPRLEAHADPGRHGGPVADVQGTGAAAVLCRKGKACGDGCISAERQCKKDQGCACSGASGPYRL